MSYSNSVATWVSGVSTTAGTKKGWRGSIWTAVNTTTTEPTADNANWSIENPVKLEGLTITQLHDPKDYLKIRISGITLMDTHVNRPPEVLLSGISLMKLRQQPYLIIG